MVTARAWPPGNILHRYHFGSIQSKFGFNLWVIGLRGEEAKNLERALHEEALHLIAPVRSRNSTWAAVPATGLSLVLRSHATSSGTTSSLRSLRMVTP